ncbi:hypothetical protein P9D31_17110 [Bacillus haynesii]|uniref:DUF6575 domain-containing protein n=1 Tax=Bacillus haynesii TaxID=1925021 RepID=UPI00227F12D6|nr:DUF6575 domain-containing protein [Bacillus haynesii]MCY8002447.1 hypothetical protein [Bacillus haynesii]MEC1474055.1 hypothetical protein [Bacillus haynesii]MEC1485127.1 hypothetical protein [Bacillus haynesii]
MKIEKYSDFKCLKIIHIFEYYDFPLFFISKSPSDELYLNYYIEETEDNLDKWLFSRISINECQSLMGQRSSVLNLLNRLYRKRRLHHLFIDCSITDPNKELKIEIVNATNFDPESFPDEDFYVEYDYATKQNLTKIEEEVIDNKFKIVLKDAQNSHDINLDFMLDIFTGFKKTINDMAQNIGLEFGAGTVNPINLKVDALQPSSFGVYIKVDSIDLFEVSERSLSNLFNLIQGISNKTKEQIEEQVFIDETYSLETIKSIRSMLRKISDNEYAFIMEGTTKVSRERKEVKFDRSSYNKLNILDEILQNNSEEKSETIEVEGELISVNTKRNKFRIATIEQEEISGKMSTELYKKIKSNRNIQFRVPSTIKAKVIKQTINDLLNDIKQVKYTLIEYEQPEE